MICYKTNHTLNYPLKHVLISDQLLPQLLQSHLVLKTKKRKKKKILYLKLAMNCEKLVGESNITCSSVYKFLIKSFMLLLMMNWKSATSVVRDSLNHFVLLQPGSEVNKHFLHSSRHPLISALLLLIFSFLFFQLYG